MTTTKPHHALAADLGRHVSGEVRFDSGSRAAYSTDSSNYRQVPIGVVVPHAVEDAEQAVAVCRQHDVPLLSRGGGTSLAGQCCNTAVIIDWSKYCRRIVSVDPDHRTAVVEPGITLDDLNRALASHGLMVGPRPSTHASCTIGGMIGNNSCGASAQAFGTMADSVHRLEVLTYDGLRIWVGRTGEQELGALANAGDRRSELYRGLRDLRDRYLGQIRTRFPRIPRRISGYNLDALLPENGFQLARALVGSESTLVTVLHAEIALVPRPRADALVMLGYPDIMAAADAVPEIAESHPLALEGFDDRLVELERGSHIAVEAINRLPEGHGWLMVQFAGDSQAEATGQARDLVEQLKRRDHAPSASVVDDPMRERQLWLARESGLGATAYPPIGRETHEGWEDAAVGPDRLADYLRDFKALLRRYGYEEASLYGHFGQGCVHTRIPFELRTARGIEAYRDFAEDSARLIASYHGSLSGEHGDGQARGELLGLMFGTDMVSAFEQCKALFDPDNRMNPGKVVHPRPLDQDLRQGTAYRPWEPPTHFAYPEDGHRFSHAAARCVGIGNCRRTEGGVMCPSYRATREEEHSTRGRARLLFEMVSQERLIDGWRSTEVRDALDLCLACKGCRSDCPVDVDMATYKAEFLSHHYARRLRPRAHYSMGWIPLWARLAALAPGAVNAISRAPVLSRLIKAAGGVDQRRTIPRFAARRFTDTFQPDDQANAVLWPDTFTNNFDPAIAHAAVRVLRAAGFTVTIPPRAVCCGLTWISTGQLPTAKRALRRTLRTLQPHLRAGTPIVVLEPSCAAVFRADLPELLHGDEDAHRLAGQTRTLAEALRQHAGDWKPPELSCTAVAHPHCHQHAILGFNADQELLTEAGVDLDILDAGCCGLAGNFGFEKSHYDVSVACAEDQLMPALRQEQRGTTVLADGFSCRTQINHLEPSIHPLHTAQLLDAAIQAAVKK